MTLDGGRLSQGFLKNQIQNDPLPRIWKQRLIGRVLDLEDRPLAGIVVSPMVREDGLNATRFYRSSNYGSVDAITDEQGEFVLDNMPDVPLILSAHRRNPADRVIRFISKVQPAMNQTDIIIRLDPTLHTEVEDLDKPKK